MKRHFAEQKMRGPGWAGQLGPGVREEIAGTGEGTAVIPPVCRWSQCSDRKQGSSLA